MPSTVFHLRHLSDLDSATCHPRVHQQEFRQVTNLHPPHILSNLIDLNLCADGGRRLGRSVSLSSMVEHEETYNELIVCQLDVCPYALQLCSNVLRIHQAYEDISVLSHMRS
jgi:hypothetical protein